jgi:hypothetical protein
MVMKWPLLGRVFGTNYKWSNPVLLGRIVITIYKLVQIHHFPKFSSVIRFPFFLLFFSFLFLNITQYNASMYANSTLSLRAPPKNWIPGRSEDSRSHHWRWHTYSNPTLPLWAPLKDLSTQQIWRFPKSPLTPRCRWERRLPFCAQRQ